MDTPFTRLSIIGLGLIGSSLALAVRRAGLARTLVGYDTSEAHAACALELGLVDHMAPTVEEAFSGADCSVLCIPVGAMKTCVEEGRGGLVPGSLLTDVGSVKGSVVRDLVPLLPEGVHFVPAHPVSGTEKSGPNAGFAELFENRWCLLTPLAHTPQAAVECIAALWRGCGARVDYMTPEHHDLVLAVTSHLPHLIAFNLVCTASDLETVTNSEVISYSAAGFRDFTRIASSDPIMWRDIFLNNKDAVLDILGRFSEELAILRRAIRWGDGKALEETFARARTIRQDIIAIGQDTPEVNFGRDRPSSLEKKTEQK